MFDSGGNDFLAHPLLRSCRSQDGDVVRFGAAAGKIDFPALTAQRFRCLFPCLVQSLLRQKSSAVQRRRVSVAIGQHLIDQLCGFLPRPGRCTVVIINFVRQKRTLPSISLFSFVSGPSF